MEIIGREEEIQLFNTLINSSKSELCAVIGRRRVGKTYLINEVIKSQLFFKFTGKYNCPLKIQLERFAIEIQNHFNYNNKPQISSWFEAFNLLRDELENSRIRKKKIIFLDEFPWMDKKNAFFVTAFGDFWTWAATRSDIFIVICGSAAAWMIKNIFKNKGSLYNRVTSRITLSPFTLEECSRFLKAKGIVWKNDALLKLYMVMGGIPFYLDQVQQGESTDQAIDRLFFPQKAILRLEFNELFASLFGKAKPYEKIVKALSEHADGLDRKKLLEATENTSGGNFTKLIDNLESSGFITLYVPFGKTEKDVVYKLTDPYTLFYLKYVQGSNMRSKQAWHYISKTPSWASWSGLAFENLCYLHINEIKKQLKIEGVHTTESVWRHKGDQVMHGAQIDLIIERADNIINICEIKYSSHPFVIDADYYKSLQKKLAAFQYFTKSKKTLFLTFITPTGLHENMYSLDFVQNNILAEKFILQ
jgi:uncharacterized protein